MAIENQKWKIKLMKIDTRFSISCVTLLIVLLGCQEKKQEPIKVTFYPSGQIKSEEFLVDSVYDKTVKIIYDSLGNKGALFEMVNGLRNGKYVKFFVNGDTMVVGFARDNLRDGSYKHFYSNGIIKRKWYYSHDKPFRSFFYFDSAGQMNKYQYFFPPDTLRYSSEFDSSLDFKNEYGQTAVVISPDTIIQSDSFYVELFVPNPMEFLLEGEVSFLDGLGNVIDRFRLNQLYNEGVDYYLLENYVLEKAGEYTLKVSIDPRATMGDEDLVVEYPLVVLGKQSTRT